MISHFSASLEVHLCAVQTASMSQKVQAAIKNIHISSAEKNAILILVSTHPTLSV